MRALVLSGGAVKGAYQVGALKRWMAEQGRDYEILTGISVGALNTASLSQVKLGDPQGAWVRLAGLWDRVENRNIRKNWRFFGKLAALWKQSIFDAQPLIDWIHQELDQDAIASSGRTLRVGATNWRTGEVQYAGEDNPYIRDWVYASACYPVAFQPARIGGELWTDGGLRDIAPVGQAVKLGATEVDIITTFSPKAAWEWDVKGKKTLDFALRALELMKFDILYNDIRTTQRKNEMSRLGASQYRQVKVRLLYPSRKLVENPLDFDPAAIKRMQEQGYADAQAQQ
jgi:NTE family protein